MNILDVAENIAREENIGLPFTIYRGGDPHHPLNSENPTVHITLADIPNVVLPFDNRVYSRFDFAHNLEGGFIYHPDVYLIPEHRNGIIAKKLVKIMERTGQQMGCTQVRVHLLVNEKLERLMPRFGYVLRGSDKLGEYVAKEI